MMLKVSVFAVGSGIAVNADGVAAKSMTGNKHLLGGSRVLVNIFHSYKPYGSF